ncbi:MAG: hypothetical protein PHX93_04450 [Candidatus Peribacteraceae bacterium]|jgi:hypothetical protein|nr:hypothetical protein [Candidatus Peribacteraceae bacterium]
MDLTIEKENHMNERTRHHLCVWFLRTTERTQRFPRPLRLCLRKRHMKAFGLLTNLAELDEQNQLKSGSRILMRLNGQGVSVY